MKSQIRILVVDDSAFMRKTLTNMIESDPELKVISSARNGEEAIEKALSLKPDLITLDIDMPRLDGLQVLKIITEKSPAQVLMVSSLTEEGAQATLDALELGAIDFIPKNLDDIALNIFKIREELTSKIKSIVRQKLKSQYLKVSKVSSGATQIYGSIIPDSRLPSLRRVRTVAVGTSTGGPKALNEIIPSLPKDIPLSILIVQHMPAVFTNTFAKRLNSISQVEVKEAEEDDIVRPGLVLIAPGKSHMKVIKRKSREVSIELSKEPKNTLYIPSADITMFSIAEIYKETSAGIILTGMGNDGTEGIRKIKMHNGRTFAQSEETCVVFGMPRNAINEGVIDKVIHLQHIAAEIVKIA
ncbi:MAG: chemotaxis response regulator protein-glutamate methylesterase [Thermodesulfobacteriota bacterium]|nr:chemotaxis response regulator protein-glutamate methylesterase [Thermodesulfobacteriota bacterium]